MKRRFLNIMALVVIVLLLIPSLTFASNTSKKVYTQEELNERVPANPFNNAIST